MKRIIFIITALSVFGFGSVNAQESTEPGTVYGTSFDAKKILAPKAVHKKLKKVGKKVDMQVEGVVESVCAKKGCWVNLKLDDGTLLFIKMKDYAFFVPMTGLEGKRVLLNGQGYKEVLSVEELQHYAADGGKSKEEIAKITQPEEKFRFTATGIKVLN